VDEKDWQEQSKFVWQATWSEGSRRFYAQRSKRLDDGSLKTVKLHREILGLTKRTPHVDHVNGNPLDNRRSNIRLATPSQNMMNKKLTKANHSGFKGVSRDPRHAHSRWVANITIQRKQKYLGTFDTKELAHAAYCAAAAELHGEFACVA
jgi:hypothetical protein